MGKEPRIFQREMPPYASILSHPAYASISQKRARQCARVQGRSLDTVTHGQIARFTWYYEQPLFRVAIRNMDAPFSKNNQTTYRTKVL